jgi:LacI family transcriptional regulator
MNRPRQVDVVKRAGVSRATVSYVLNGLTKGRVPISDETRQRVLNAIEELGYEPDARAGVGFRQQQDNCSDHS